MKETEQKTKNETRLWFAVHTQSGYEEAVSRYLKQRIESLSMGDKIFEVIVPKEKKIKVKGGSRETIEEKIYPGYVLVNMILTEDSWYVVRNTPRVDGFVGPDKTTPTPLSEVEVRELLDRMSSDESTFKVDLRAGDLVKITDGPFKEYEGKISEVDEEKGRLKIMVPIFGRDTAVDLDALQVKKV